ncbi:hypothetical protein BC940DRAFT_318367 [Gongronella butleri]|nr:hypothetical protein BC940DRAFT_318367 [Gongronella butleri]
MKKRQEHAFLDGHLPLGLPTEPLLSNTRPPSSFDQVSLFSHASQKQLHQQQAVPESPQPKRQAIYSAHDIWANGDNTPDPAPPMSPGKYFKARSLPLASVHDIWNHHQPAAGSHEGSIDSHSISNTSAPSGEDLLNTYFKALPSTLHRRSEWILPGSSKSKSQMSTNHAQDAMRDMENANDGKDEGIETTGDDLSGALRSLRVENRAEWSVQPADQVVIAVQVAGKFMNMQAAHVTVTNATASAQTIAFRLYSEQGFVVFDTQQGTIEPGSTRDIPVRLRTQPLKQWLAKHADALDSGPIDYQNETIAVWIDKTELHEIKVVIDVTAIESDDDDDDDERKEASLEPQITSKMPSLPPPSPEITQDDDNCDDCPFCILEQRYPALFEQLQ